MDGNRGEEFAFEDEGRLWMRCEREMSNRSAISLGSNAPRRSNWEEAAAAARKLNQEDDSF